MRLDKFLQLSRLVKRRTVAQAVCATGRVRLNGVEAKPASAVKPGDVITLTQGDRRVLAKVLTVPTGAAGGSGLVEILGRIHLPDLVSEPTTHDAPTAPAGPRAPIPGGVSARFPMSAGRRRLDGRH